MAELKTFIFTDIVRSVALKNEMSGRNDSERDRAFIDSILTPHRIRIEANLAELGGRIVSTAGDGHFLVFSDTIQAAIWAVDVQNAHASDPITTPRGGVVEVRISMHVGAPQVDPRDPNNYVGKTVDYAARLNDFAQGGQILVSRSVASMLDDAKISGISIHRHGDQTLRGIGTVEVHELVYRAAGPMDTIYEPANLDEREFTVVDAGPAAGAPSAAASSPSQGAANGSSSDPNEPTVLHAAEPRRLGNYELGELLGSGGMGDVFRARHTQFGRVRAIKVIKQHFVDAGHEDIVRRFYQEIKATGAIEHPNIVVAVESSAPTDRVHYLVMEYIEGIPLGELVTAHGPLAVPDACEIIRQAAWGLEYIHRLGMVHRDIKPSNLMLTVSDSPEIASDAASTSPPRGARRGVVKILDLGLALLAGEENDRLTRFDQRAMGTGMYMSPEQWKTTSVDIRADIYSLGCTLYHLLEGRPPFQESDLKPEKAHERSPVPPIDGDAEMTRDLWDIIKKMLAKRPEDRYQSPAEVATALAPFCRGNDVASIAQRYAPSREGAHSSIGTSVANSTAIEPPSRTASSRRPAAARRALPYVGPIVAACVVVLAFAGWYFGLRRDPLVRDGELASAAAEAVGTLPGMSGVWWFDETPWLFPEERARLFYAMRESEYAEFDALSRDADVEAFYASIRETLPPSGDSLPENALPPTQFTSPLYAKCRATLDGLDPIAREGRETMDGLLDALRARPEEERSPVEWHLIGVLHAALQEREAANEALFEAQAGYGVFLEGEAAPVARGLLALCLSDRATIAATPPEEDQLIQSAIDVLETGAAPSFEVFMMGSQSLARLNDPNRDNAAIAAPLEEAEKRLAGAKPPFAAEHPLRAFIHERRAHYLLETWQLKEAKDEATRAIEMRNRFGKIGELKEDENGKGGRSQGYHFAQQAYFRDVQILALAEHYLGVVLRQPSGVSIPTAYQTFDDLLNYVKKVSDYKLTQAQEAIWSSLTPNFLGRQADCQLFLMGEFAEAEATMVEAIRYARELDWQEQPAKRHNLVFMHYKRAIALSLAGKSAAARVERGRAADEAAKVDPGDEGRFHVFAEVAEALDLPEEEQRADALMRILKAVVPNLGPRRRDDRQLLLFVCEYLIQLKETAAERDKTFENLDLAELNRLKELLVDPTGSGDDIPVHYRALIGKSARAYLKASTAESIEKPSEP